MAARQKSISEQARKQLELQSQALILGLFHPNQQPFFEQSDYSKNELEAFIKSNDVYKETVRFVSALKTIWKTQNPDSRPLMTLPVLPLQLHDANAQSISSPTQESAMNVQEPILPESFTPTEQMITPEPELSVVPAPIQPGQTPPANTPPRSPSALVPNVRFTLPNAKVGVAYQARMEGHSVEGAVQIVELRLPDDLGLHFDAEHVELHGIPTLAGEHVLRVLWTLDRRERYSSECVLIVNPDPKTLWQVKEPAADAPYFKAHTAQQSLTGFGFRVAAASRRGRSHEHNGTFRDDDFVISLIPNTNWTLLLVADGAGSASVSREGSRLAVTAASELLTQELSTGTGAKLTEALNHWESDSEAQNTIGSECHYLFHRAATRAVEAIEREARQHNTEIRNYATTLLAAIVNRHGNDTFLATFWMGDGAIAAYGPRGKVRLMGTPDGGEFAGQTRFLDRAALVDQSFAKRIGMGRFADLTAILLMTDGVSDPRFETDRGLTEAANWDALWDELQPILTSANPAPALCDWLHFFTAGHHDDRTLAVLW